MTWDTARFHACRLPVRSRKAHCVALALTLAPLAFATDAAQAQRGGEQGLFERLDADGNGIIDRHELNAARLPLFERADADGDGMLSGGELETFASGQPSVQERLGRGPFANAVSVPVKDLLRRVDTNRDGRISEKELLEAENPLLQRLDRDGDGGLSRKEIDRAQTRSRRRIL